MLGLARKQILHEYTGHAMTDHDYPVDRGAALVVFACPLCELMIKRLHESELWTEENYVYTG